ncbi:2',3'-cyclic-nucleotide 3'-phosphodiesterase, partial [Epithele typhae]|uniref:2',3'-cyclic-nucleotide 3'-phosphodiesterase n=1 Tax=Epithele typhae TaxID=378194 RepID=UPI002008626A
GISLWLVPDKSTSKKIATAMAFRPLTAPQSPSSFPTFQPHVTLATSSESALRAAMSPMPPTIPITFRSLEVGAKYFMSVYLAVHAAPASPLAALRAHLRAALPDGARAVPPVPHVSLYYIDDADAGLRAVTARMLRTEFRVLESGTPGSEDSKVTLACYFDERGEGQDPELVEGFRGEEIWLVNCDGPVEGWEVLEKYPLVG